MKPILSAVMAAAVLSGLLVAVAPPAAADLDAHAGTVAERPRDASVHAVDGEVRTIAQVGNRVVIGGTFTQVGPVTRGAVGIVDTAGKTFQAGFPEVVGAVSAVASDGAGGWYVGGTFSQVGGQSRSNLAQVDATGAVTAFSPQPNGPVAALAALPGGGVVVGGDFTTLAGGAANRLAALSTAGTLLWSGDVAGGVVRALAVSGDGTRLYLGGDFVKVDTVDRKRFAAVGASTGVLEAGFLPGTLNLSVNDIVVQGGAVLVAGDFTKVGGATRNRLARVDAVTGALDPLTVSVNNSVRDIELDTVSDTLYLAGRFSSVGGSSRAKLAGITLSTGAVTSLSLPNITGDLAAVTLDGAGGLFVGGSMQFTPEKDSPAAIARVAITTGVTTEVVPYYQTPRSLARPPVSGTSGPTVLARSGGSLLVAGDFSDYGVTTRNRLAAYDLASGALSPDFNPAPDAQVNTVKASADSAAIYVGGEFTTIAGQPASRLAKLDILTGNPVIGFAASANSYVKDMAVRPDDSAVYVGGNFDTFNGVPASRLVAINPATGALRADFAMPLTEPTNDDSEGGLRAMALSSDSGRLMVIGNFRKVAGVDRPLIAQIDVSAGTATVTPWRTDLYDQPCARSGKVGFMRDVDISPDGTKAFVVSAGHFYYPACDTANAFPMTSSDVNVMPLWSKKIGDTMESVAASTDTVYISGHFRYLETETKTEPRFQIAALDVQSGNGLNWIPNAGGFRGVLTVELEPAGLFAGSDGDAFGVVNHGRNAFWPTPTPGIEVRKSPNLPWVLTPGANVTYTVRVQNTFSDRAVSVTALSDSRLGSLAGAGTCVLPQLISAGESYSCTVSEDIAGAAGTEVSGNVTATATPQGAPAVSDTDTSRVQILATAAMFRMRVVVGPAQIPFPGATTRFSITLMNLDLKKTATLTTLTSPQFGNLAAECGLPANLPPNELRYCHLDRYVGGSVGSKPVYSFTSQASYDTGVLSASGSPSVTINPPIGGSKVLTVVANPGTLSASDKKVQDFLDDTFVVTLVDDDTVNAASVTSDYSFVVLSSSVVATKLGTRLAGVTTPVMLTHSQLLDEMGMTAAGANATQAGTTMDITAPMHPLSAARFGVQTINSEPQTIGWGVPSPGAKVISQVEAGKPTEFAYRTGAVMSSGASAPACRVFFSAVNPTKFTAVGKALFQRAAAYTGNDCGKNMLWTAAGNGATSYGGADGRTSLSVGLNQPWGLAVDQQNRIYVADGSNHAVRRIDADGTVTTVAGSGVAGFSGDGGPATAARLNGPVRITFTTGGDLLIADSVNNRIRKVTPAGVISTVAGNGLAGFSGDGGPATAARLRTPYDVAVKADGTLLIADRANHRVRAVTPAGVISTVAGAGVAGYNGDGIAATAARLSSPYSVASDADGNVYIADYDNERVRLVDSGGVITTFAGTGVATADGDGGPAVEAGLHKPTYVQVTPTGDVIICESNNNDVRVVHEGLIDTLAGSRQFGYVGDGGLPIFSTWQRPSATVFDQQGNLWIADRNNRRLRVIGAS